jgi:hypothetical protein
LEHHGRTWNRGGSGAAQGLGARLVFDSTVTQTHAQVQRNPRTAIVAAVLADWSRYDIHTHTQVSVHTYTDKLPIIKSHFDNCNVYVYQRVYVYQDVSWAAQEGYGAGAAPFVDEHGTPVGVLVLRAR